MIQNQRLASMINRFIAIDTGKNTGYFIFDIDNHNNIIDRELSSGSITQVIEIVKQQKLSFSNNLYLIVEDARLCKWNGNHSGAEFLQKVGSVKRDARIWEDFCVENNIFVWLINPLRVKNKKLNREQFELIFKRSAAKTNEHSRDAYAIGLTKCHFINYQITNGTYIHTKNVIP